VTLPIFFTVPGVPVAKGRPRLTTIGGKARAFTPAKTVLYEQLVALAAQRAIGGAGPLEGALSVTVTAFLPVPASWSRKKRDAALAGDIRPTSRPDTDNYLKAALDGMNGIVYRDDAQVVRVVAAKFYGTAPELGIWVREAQP
jgi:Holliday junction resolvase RusA-like endonuclease